MPWSVEFRHDLNIVETRYEGILRPDELRTAIEKTLELSVKENALLFLGDCSRLEGGHSVVDLYAMVDMVEVSGVAHGLREAIIMPSLASPAKDVLFWETAAMNRGFHVRVFPDRDQALAWLLESTPS
jgi:hypothetical protein